MQTIDLTLNGTQVLTIGGEGYDLLTFGFIRAHNFSSPKLLLTGWKKASDSHVEWDTPIIRDGDIVGVTCRRLPPNLQEFSVSTMPISGSHQANGSTETCNSTQRCKVSFQSGVTFEASVLGDTTLQVTIDLHALADHPILRVGCLRDDQTQMDEMWFETAIPFNELTEFAVEFD